METINVQLHEPVFTRLQTYATPLVDDVNSVIVKLMDAYDGGLTGRASDVKLWRSTRGETLPIGTKMRKIVGDQSVFAIVTEGGIKVAGLDHPFDSPSAAAVAAKPLLGLTESAENGWNWWQCQKAPNLWVPLNMLRSRTR